jgi:hypothetical protein
VLRHVEPREAGVRRVQHVHLDFIRHGLLMGQVVLRDLQAQHAVRLGPQHGLEFIAGTISTTLKAMTIEWKRRWHTRRVW